MHLIQIRREVMMRAIATTLIVLATATAGCVTPSYRTDVYGPPSTATYYATAPTYVYAATPKQSCEAAGGQWHTFSRTCTIPR